MIIEVSFDVSILQEKPHIREQRYNPNKPKFVILLAYQRVGSSFLAQIFNQNPGAFYMFEPIDGIYSAMYGTQEGFTVPSDIAFFWNGTSRSVLFRLVLLLKFFLVLQFSGVTVEIFNK